MNNKILGWNHFRQNLNEAEKNIIRSIRLKNLFNPTTLLILPWDIICERHNIIFAMLEKIHLSSLVTNALRIFRHNLTKGTSNITSIFNTNKKGSRKFRQILEESQFQNINKSNKSLRKRLLFASSSVNAIADRERDCNFYKLFWISKLKLERGEFIFNFNNNLLYTNKMILHFILNIEPACPRYINARLPPP